MLGASMRGVIQLFTENPYFAGGGLQLLVYFIIVLYLVLWKIDSVDRLGVMVLFHEVDSRPVCLSLGILERFVPLHSFSAFLLRMPLQPAEVAIFVVPVCVVSAA